jgi:hypothetical protein
MPNINPLKMLLILMAIYMPSKVSAQCTATLTASTTGICVYNQVSLSASPTGLYDYQWFINGSLGPLGMEVWNYNAFQPGTYTFEVQITDNNNCTVISNPVTVTVYPEPDVYTTAIANLICVGSTLQLQADTSNATAISWTGPNGFTSNLANPTISNFQVANIGTYIATASNGGCSSTSQIEIDTMTAVPSLTADLGPWWNITTNPVCEGEWIQLQANHAGFVTPSFSWTGTNGFTSTGGNINFFNATVADSAIYTLTVTGATCTGTATLTDTVYAGVTASPVITATSNGPVCTGATLDLTGTVTNGTFEWTGPNSYLSTNVVSSITNMQTINSGTYTLTATNGNCTASETVNGVVIPATPSYQLSSDSGQIFCAGDNSSIFVYQIQGILNPVITTTGPNGFSVIGNFTNIPITDASDSGMYYVNVSGTNCNGPVSLTSGVLIDVRPCVWPGDVNNDMIANNMDVLDLGLGYGNMGPNRPNASYQWTGQYMTDWGSMQFCNQEMKFADCNGNGILTASDTFGIALNYGETHLKGIHMPQAKSAAWPELFFDMSGITLTPGAAVSIPIKLGTSTIPMVNVYGLAAQVKVTGITPDNLYISAPAGWMGNINSTMNFTKIITQTQTDWAYVRIDHTNVSGEGTIALLQFTVPPGTDYQQVQMYFDNVRIIGNTGNVITDVNIVDDTATVYPAAVASTQTIINSAAVVPNPSESEATLQLSLIQASMLDIIVTDITGRKVWNNNIKAIKGHQEIVLPSSGLASGIYTIQVRDEKGNPAKTMKWIKK